MSFGLRAGRVCLLGGLAVGLIGALGQAPANVGKLPVYEVVSVKPNKSGLDSMSWSWTPDGLRLVDVTLTTLIRASDYTLRHAANDRIMGLPGWADKARFDIEAKVSEEDVPAFNKLDGEQRSVMFRRLMEDRFKMKAHTETREMPLYALVLAKGGVKMTPTKEADARNESYGGMSMGSKGGVTHAEYRKTAMDDLADNLTQNLGRTVVDKTGLKGKYDFALEWTPEDAPDGSTSTVPGIFTAIQQQLGLRLEAQKGPVEGLVVDHVEEPSAN